MLCRSGDVRVEAQRLGQLGLRAGADRALDDLAVLQQEQGGDARDAECACQLRLGVDVDLADLDPALA